MKKRTPIKWRDKDGDVWNQHDDPRFLWDADIQYRRDTVEKQWGPLTPIEWEEPPPLWTRATASWQRRLTIATAILATLISLINGILAVMSGVDPTWYFIGPILFIGGIVLAATGLIRTLAWIWPELNS